MGTQNPINPNFQNVSGEGQILVGESAGVFSPLILTADDNKCLTANSGASNGVEFDDFAPIVFYQPVLTGSTTAGTVTYVVQEGFHASLGTLVVLWVNLSFNSFTGTGNLQVSLPVASGATANNAFPGTCLFTGAYSGSGTSISAQVPASSSIANLISYVSGGSLTTQQCVATADLKFCLVYSLV